MWEREGGVPRVRRLARREFLMASAVAAGGLASARLGIARAAGSAGTPAMVGGLTAARAATFGALLTALRNAPDGRFGHAAPGDATTSLGRWYAAQDEPVRGHVDAVLDELGAAALRYDDLAQPTASCADAAAARRRAAIAAGVDLAALACEPPPPPGDRPLTPALEPRA